MTIIATIIATITVFPIQGWRRKEPAGLLYDTGRVMLLSFRAPSVRTGFDLLNISSFRVMAAQRISQSTVPLLLIAYTDERRRLELPDLYSFLIHFCD